MLQIARLDPGLMVCRISSLVHGTTVTDDSVAVYTSNCLAWVLRNMLCWAVCCVVNVRPDINLMLRCFKVDDMLVAVAESEQSTAVLQAQVRSPLVINIYISYR